MKEELKKLPYVPKSKEDLKRELQKLWDRINLRDFKLYTKRLTCKIKDVIKVRSSTTIY
jgi:hypothetical protein